MKNTRSLYTLILYSY